MKILLIFCFFCLSYGVSAHEEFPNSQESSLAISVAFDSQGGLWRVLEKNGLLWIDSSRDLGKTFSSPIQITLSKQEIGSEGEVRPKIAIGPEGNIYLTWSETLKLPFAGNIWFSRSINSGKSFEKPTMVHSDSGQTPHRIDALNVSKDGKITVAWVDKRNLIAAKDTGNQYDGSAIYYAVSTNQGASFDPDLKLADKSCDCCRIAFTNKPDGTVVAMWRNIFENNERDHMMAEIPLLPKKVPITKRVTFGRWRIDGCPQHGPALAAGGEGADWWGYHIAWFDGGNDDSDKSASLFYARMDGEAWVSTPPKRFGKHSNQAGHPALLSIGERVWLVWLEIENKNNIILGMYSDDGGRSWGDAKVIGSSVSKSDYPQLLVKGNEAYLAWNTEHDGLVLLGL